MTDDSRHDRRIDSEVLERALALVPRVEEAADWIEENRRLPPDLVDSLRDAGLLRLYLPKELGGTEASPFTLLAVVEAFSRVDGSTAWCVNVANQAAWLASILRPEVAREFIGPDSILLSSAIPSGGPTTATPVKGGYLVNGRWSFASGAPHATVLSATCDIAGSGPPDPSRRIYVFLPTSECRVLDTWDTVGMRGTGSHDFEVRDVFVPEERTASSSAAAPQVPGPLFKVPFIRFAGRGTLALGIARHALDAFTELAQTKTAMGTAAPLKQQEFVQVALAEAEASWASARCWLMDTTASLWETLSAGDVPPYEIRAQFALSVSHAARTSLRVTEEIFALSGTTAIRRNWPVERCLRDLHTANTDISVGRMILGAAGRAYLKEGPPLPLL